MKITEQRVLEYVHSVGWPTKADLTTLHGPVGALLLPKLINIDLLRDVGDERVLLTDIGKAALRS